MTFDIRFYQPLDARSNVYINRTRGNLAFVVSLNLNGTIDDIFNEEKHD
jgi:hypothetical protein